ncbi:MAG: hypothetical protein IRZ33_03330 [Alicyclobacillaceae bacterium]|nr:hypothetical protein [Alicyclobacillaceae bacterium]
MQPTGSLWRAFHESLGHWLYWAIILVFLFGAILFFSRREARRMKRTGPGRPLAPGERPDPGRRDD